VGRWHPLHFSSKPTTRTAKKNERRESREPDLGDAPTDGGGRDFTRRSGTWTKSEHGANRSVLVALLPGLICDERAVDPAKEQRSDEI
jgi:hypothetical protein